MNRSILIVICDFLLVNLVAFSTVDINKVADEGTRGLKLEVVTNQVDSGRDLTAVMRLALDQERENRDRLLGELVKTRDTLTRQQSLLTEQQARLGERERQVQAAQQELTARDQRLALSQQALAERDRKVQAFQQELSAREQQARRLAQDQLALQQQLAAAQTNLNNLNRQLHDSTVQSVISGEKLAALEDLVQRQTFQATNLQQQLADLARSNQVVVAEKQRLGTQLQLAETEKRFAAQQVAYMQDEVRVEREEKARLAEGVKGLARAVRESRGLTANAIFSAFVTNRVQARFSAIRTIFFGASSKSKEAETVLVSDGANTYALCHVQDTPLTIWEPGTDWEGLTGTLSRNLAACPIRALSFCLADPRVVLMPLTAEEARRLGCAIYRASTEPYMFQDAVLVGTRADYYGECRFQLDLSTPDYVKLDRSFLKGLLGKFNPSRGDLVFSKTGELLGIMANSSYCLILRSFTPEATFHCGDDVRSQRTGATLSALYSHLVTLPFKLQ